MHITGGYLKSRKIISPKSENVRPTLSQIRESIFSTLFSLIDFENKTFLDAFAGSGIMGFEAISRGFKSVTFIEKDKKTLNIIKENSSKLNISADFYVGDSIKILPKLQKQFDVIYIDPPYQSGLYASLINIIIKSQVLSPNCILILEHPKNLTIDLSNINVIKQKNYSDKTITYAHINFE